MRAGRQRLWRLLLLWLAVAAVSVMFGARDAAAVPLPSENETPQPTPDLPRRPAIDLTGIDAERASRLWRSFDSQRARLTARLNRKYKGAPPDDAKAALNQGLLEYLDDLVVRARLPTRDQLKTMHNQAGVLAKQIERQTALAEEAKAKAVQAQQSIPAAVAEVQRLETDAPHAEAKGRSDYWVGRVNASLGAARRRLANLRAEVDRLTAEADAAERKAAEARDQLAQKRAAIADADRRVREHKEQQQKRGGESGAEAGDATPAPVAERNKGGGQRRPRRRKGDNADGTSKFTADFSLSSALSLLAHRRDSLLASLGQAQQSMRDVAAYFPKAVQQQAKSAVTSPRQPIPLVPPVKAGVAGFVPH